MSEKENKEPLVITITDHGSENFAIELKNGGKRISLMHLTELLDRAKQYFFETAKNNIKE